MSHLPNKSHLLWPKVEEIIEDTAPFPYTLGAFMDFLCRNHCIETLEFILEARRYRKTFSLLRHTCGDSPIANAWKDQMILQWQRLMTVYIAPSAPSQINLSPAVRAKSLEATSVQSPPSPDLLEPAIQSMFRLINDSVLTPFSKECTEKPHVLSLSEPSLAIAGQNPTTPVDSDRRTTRSSPSSEGDTYRITDRYETDPADNSNEPPYSLKREFDTPDQNTQRGFDPMEHSEHIVLSQPSLEVKTKASNGNGKQDSEHRKPLGKRERLLHMSSIAKSIFKPAKK